MHQLPINDQGKALLFLPSMENWIFIDVNPLSTGIQIKKLPAVQLKDIKKEKKLFCYYFLTL